MTNIRNRPQDSILLQRMLPFIDSLETEYLQVESRKIEAIFAI